MPLLDPFIEPLRGTAAQTLIVALLVESGGTLIDTYCYKTEAE